MLKKAVIISLAALLGACANVKKTPEADAISYALVHDVTLRKLADRCSNVSTSAKQASWRSLNSWWKRNGSLVEAADYGLTYNMVSLSGDRLETGARYAMGLTFDIVSMADQEVASLLGSRPSEGMCKDLMESYRSGEKDIREGSEHYSELVKLQQQSDAKGRDLTLEIAKLTRKKGKTFSRSAYTVERMLKREGCAGAKISTLKADWPHEVFESRCADNSYMLIRCEWGNCKVQD